MFRSIVYSVCAVLAFECSLLFSLPRTCLAIGALNQAANCSDLQFSPQLPDREAYHLRI
jgi:hypothetical protein